MDHHCAANAFCNNSGRLCGPAANRCCKTKPLNPATAIITHGKSPKLPRSDLKATAYPTCRTPAMHCTVTNPAKAPAAHENWTIVVKKCLEC